VPVFPIVIRKSSIVNCSSLHARCFAAEAAQHDAALS
jgi:hypothetical protein